jgi:hypothetical protein
MKWSLLLVFPFVFACSSDAPTDSKRNRWPEGGKAAVPVCRIVADTTRGYLELCPVEDALCVVNNVGGLQCFPARKGRTPSPAPSASPGAAK